MYDVIVAGAGNAALCAALAARDAGASVTVLERAPEDERGGNSRFTAGGMDSPSEKSTSLLRPGSPLVALMIANSPLVVE